MKDTPSMFAGLDLTGTEDGFDATIDLAAQIAETRQQKRKRQLAEAQARRRAKKRGQGDIELRITLTSMEWQEFETLRKQSNYPLAAFPLIALMRGARFAANSGRVQKVKRA